MNQETADAAEFILLGFPDVNGVLRGKALRPDAFAAAVEHGAATTDLLLGLDPLDNPISDYGRFGIRSGAADLVLRPVPDTLRNLTWREGWKVCLGTPEWADGTPCTLASREVLRAALVSMADLGYEVLAAVEYEVRLRDADGRHMSSGSSYNLAAVAALDDFVRPLRRALDALGVEVTAVHTEAAPGLLELNLAPRRGVEAADCAAYTKFAVKELAAARGLHASFLAKTAVGEEGSSGHIHLSCWKGGNNAFAGARDEIPGAMSSAIAGVLEHLPAASLLMNPNINSYKRLVPGWFAPTNVSWGIENRSAAVRAIRGGTPESWRIECRRPGADANPYLAIAAVAAAAADGMRRKLRPPSPVSGDAYARGDLAPLPTSLDEAVRAFESDAAFRTSLGEDFSDYFLVSRRWELKAWQQTVTDWERARYEGSV